MWGSSIWRAAEFLASKRKRQNTYKKLLLRTHLEFSPTLLRKNVSPPNGTKTGKPDRKLCEPQNPSSSCGWLFPTTWDLVHNPRPDSEFRFYVEDLNRLIPFARKQTSNREKHLNPWTMTMVPCHNSLAVQQFLVKNQISIPPPPKHFILHISHRSTSGFSRDSKLGSKAVVFFSRKRNSKDGDNGRYSHAKCPGKLHDHLRSSACAKGCYFSGDKVRFHTITQPSSSIVSLVLISRNLSVLSSKTVIP